MAWITTKDGRKVNTDWFEEDERKKYEQIEKAQKEADELNGRPAQKERVENAKALIEHYMKQGKTLDEAKELAYRVPDLDSKDISIKGKSTNDLVKNLKEKGYSIPNVQNAYGATMSQDLNKSKTVTLYNKDDKTYYEGDVTVHKRSSGINGYTISNIRRQNKSSAKSPYDTSKSKTYKTKGVAGAKKSAEEMAGQKFTVHEVEHNARDTTYQLRDENGHVAGTIFQTNTSRDSKLTLYSKKRKG